MILNIAKNDNETQSSWIYLIGYSIILFCTFINSTTFHSYFSSFVSTSMRLLGYMFMIFYFLNRRRIKKKLFYVAIIMLAISLLSLYRTGYSVLLDYAICCVCAIDVDFNKIVKVYVYECTAFTGITIASALSGIIENYIYYRRATGNIRMALGFVYPTNFAAHVFFIMVGVAYLCYEKFNWKYIVGYGIVAYIIYLLTNARGPSAMIVALAIVVNAYRHFSLKGISIIPKWLLKYSTLICAVLTFVMIYFYNSKNKFWGLVNSFTTNRLAYAKSIMNNNSITLLGRYIEQRGDGNGGRLAGESYTYIDLSFERILLMYGLLLFIFILIYSILLFNKSYKSKNISIPLLLFVIAFYSLTAQHYFDFSYNFILLSYFAIIPEQNIVERRQHKIISIRRRTRKNVYAIGRNIR